MIKNDSDTSIDFEEINFAFFTLLVNRQILHDLILLNKIINMFIMQFLIKAIDFLRRKNDLYYRRYPRPSRMF